MPAEGQLFAGDYRVVRPLSAGGMGAIYIVEQLSTGKQRALKVMHPALIADPDLRKRFEQEARIGARIESAHVVEVQAAGVDAATGVPWLVMELLAGEDLMTLVTRDGGLSPGRVHEIFEQLCHALASAHRAGIVHRDLKPENVFVGAGRHAGGRMEAKVLDFGIAKLAEESGTRSTAAMGSPAWMAPEQTERGVIDTRADVWALGLLAYWALTGRFFWKKIDQTWVHLAREIMIEPLPTATQRAAEQACAARVPPGFDAWFARCVARDPNARFANASEAWASLAQLLRDAPPAELAAATAPAMAPLQATVAAPTLARRPPPPPAPSPPAKRPVVLIGLVAVVALVVITGLAALVARTFATTDSPPRPTSSASVATAVVSVPAADSGGAPPSPALAPPKPQRPKGAAPTPRPACTCHAGDPLCDCL